MTTSSPRNEIFGFPIPLGHFAVIDSQANTLVLYQRWRKVSDPEQYLRRYWGAPPSPTAA